MPAYEDEDTHPLKKIFPPKVAEKGAITFLKGPSNYYVFPILQPHNSDFELWSVEE